MTGEFWSGRRVLITGHTGFKGAWLATWLRELGAVVLGYALAPPSTPSLFERARVGELVEHVEGDVRDLKHVREAFWKGQPEIVFHLAAQSLVRVSYESPVETFSTNVMGTVNVLEAAARQRGVRAVVIVTSDKCYENREWPWPYRECDRLGGHDPYSASKACAELITASYRSALAGADGPRIASVRAGNVIGGGDWARDRLVPDLVMAAAQKSVAVIRNPASVRPWQHVTEPLWGYLTLAEALFTRRSQQEPGAWNFGPSPESVQPVATVADTICRLWGGGAEWKHDSSVQPHEARTLTLDSSKARLQLGWSARLELRAALGWTVDWYKSVFDGRDAREATLTQIRRYMELPS